MGTALMFIRQILCILKTLTYFILAYLILLNKIKAKMIQIFQTNNKVKIKLFINFSI